MQQALRWSPPLRRLAPFALVALSLVVLPAAAQAADEAAAEPATQPAAQAAEVAAPTADTTATTAPAAEPVAGDAVRIYRDPETGRLGRVPQQAPQSQAEEQRMMLNESAEGLQVRVLRNGAEAIDLQGRFRSFAVAKRNPDGTIATACGDSMDEARANLDARTKATQKEDRDDQ